MKRTIGLLATLVVLASLPTTAEAQRHRGNGTVNTPFGQFNMNEMRAAGGDPFAAQELRGERMALQYQQSLMKQHQQYMQQLAKQEKAKQDALKKNPAAAKSETAAASATAPATDQPKAKGTAKASGKAAKSSKAATDSSSTAKVPGAPPTSSKSK